jgi:pantothenate kinase-related protein Tda10
MNLFQAFQSAQAEIEKLSGVSFEKGAVAKYYLPLIHFYINDKKENETYMIGIQGSQGVGKTSLTHLIVGSLNALGYKAIGFSIDDFYFSFADRKEMQKRESLLKFPYSINHFIMEKVMSRIKQSK